MSTRGLGDSNTLGRAPPPDKYLRTLSPEQYELLAVHIHEGMTRAVVLNRIVKADLRALNYL